LNQNNNVFDKRTDSIETLVGKQGDTALLQNIVILQKLLPTGTSGATQFRSIANWQEKRAITLPPSSPLVRPQKEKEARAVASNNYFFGSVCIRQRKSRSQILLTIRTSLLPLA
jgi:hypothetical protein